MKDQQALDWTNSPSAIMNKSSFNDEVVALYTQAPWNCMVQQGGKCAYSRHKAAGLVILVQGFITQKMCAYRLVLREFS